MDAITNQEKLESIDEKVIMFFRKNGMLISRSALFIIFFWFGILKVFLLSPAGPLVSDLLNVTFLGFIDANTFNILFGVFECIIGLMILFPRLERITFAVLLFHLFTTVMPLYLLPQHAWDGFMVPSLVGQYIIKNAALLSLGIVLFAHLKPMTKTHSIIGVEETTVS
jgi:uncharacterized membrane protein YkgB